MELMLLIVFGFIMIIVASAKGFNPLRWFFAAGLLGLIVLSFLPSASAKGIDENEKLKRVQRGNKVGTIISIMALILAAMLIIAGLIASGDPDEIMPVILVSLVFIGVIMLAVFIFLKLKKIKPVKTDKALIAVHAFLGIIFSAISWFLTVALVVALKLEHRSISPAFFLAIAIIETISVTYVLGRFLWSKRIRNMENEIDPVNIA